MEDEANSQWESKGLDQLIRELVEIREKLVGGQFKGLYKQFLVAAGRVVQSDNPNLAGYMKLTNWRRRWQCCKDEDRAASAQKLPPSLGSYGGRDGGPRR